MTNLFFSISPSEFEASLKEEIWGCYKYIGIPIETIYSMPVHDRKFFIMKHNMDVKEENEKTANNSNSGTITGEALNNYAAKEMG